MSSLENFLLLHNPRLLSQFKLKAKYENNLEALVGKKFNRQTVNQFGIGILKEVTITGYDEEMNRLYIIYNNGLQSCLFLKTGKNNYNPHDLWYMVLFPIED